MLGSHSTRKMVERFEAEITKKDAEIKRLKRTVADKETALAWFRLRDSGHIQRFWR